MSKEKFEEALEKLEEIVHRMEAGEMTLEESLKAFEEGINRSLRQYNPEYWRNRQAGLEKVAPPPERPPAQSAER